MLLLVLTTLGSAFADDAYCSLQKVSRGPIGFDREVRHLEREDVQPKDLWTRPGLEFRQCPKLPVLSKNIQLQVRHQLNNLMKKPTCSGGQVLIGDFMNGSYKYTCCNAGEQCGGCRVVRDGACRQCAAGYVMQTVPVVNISKCFMCDDVPNWHDMQGRTCADLQQDGICSGAWPKTADDVQFQGLRPSEACCACGGGSVYPTPVYMPLQSKSLYAGQYVDATPEPITAEVVEVAPGCTFGSSGLTVASNGRVSGVVAMKQNVTEISCSTVSVQDPVRGIVTQTDFSIPLSKFSYGEQVVYFKFWGLDGSPSDATVPLHSRNMDGPQSLQLQCDTACSWLSMIPSGALTWIETGNRTGLPEDLTEQVTTLAGMPSCNCQVLGHFPMQGGVKAVTPQFLVSQARLWKGGAWKVPNITARISEEISEVPLLEDLGSSLSCLSFACAMHARSFVRPKVKPEVNSPGQGPGFQWYNRSGHVFEVPIVENIATGEKFIVSKSIPPSILDVECKVSGNEGKQLKWSRISGDVTLEGDVAFKLDPQSGMVSGTPGLSLPATQGRAELTINCQVALGGQEPSMARVAHVEKKRKTHTFRLTQAVFWIMFQFAA